MPYLDRDGVRLYYEVAGSGPAILLTHGFAASSRMFAKTVPPLAVDHTVITWDMRGHGQTDYPEDTAEYTVPLVMGDMAALLDEAGADRGVILGHSVGGYLALEFNLAFPERVDALVLEDTGPGYRKDEGREGWNAMAESYAVEFEEKDLDGIHDSEELDPSVHRDATGLIKAARGILKQYDSRVISSLESITVPVLIVVGEQDENFVNPSKYMAAKIPGARLEIVPDAGHSPNMAQPEVFDAALRSFLADLPRGVK